MVSPMPNVNFITSTEKWTLGVVLAASISVMAASASLSIHHLTAIEFFPLYTQICKKRTNEINIKRKYFKYTLVETK